MFALVFALFIAGSTAFIDLFLSHLCMQPFIFCTLAYYTTVLYTKNPYQQLLAAFLVLMLLAHFLYGDELRLFWYLIPLTIASSFGQRLIFSKRYQPAILMGITMVVHRLFIDGLTVQSLLVWDCTTICSVATLILVALFSLK